MMVEPRPLCWNSGKTAREWMATVRPSSLFPNEGSEGSSEGMDMSLSSTVLPLVLVATMWPSRTHLRAGAPL